MENLFQDVRYGLRTLLKSPGFTVVAVITLALGIGANSAIFSIVNGLLLRPLPYKNSERLAIIWTHSPGANVDQDWPSPGQYSAIVNGNTTFEELGLAIGNNVILTGRGTPERLGAIYISSNMFSILGARPEIGRAFLPEEDMGKEAKTVILGYGTWKQRFGGDPDVLGQSLTINGESSVVVGVMPADFSLGYEVMPTVSSVQQAELLLPLPMTAEDLANQGDENYNIIARIKPGATFAQAQSELDAVASGLEQQYPANYPPSRRFSYSVRPLLEQVVGDVRLALLILLGAVAFVLLIACANVANLQLARAAARERELAIRAALGASRLRIVRQLLTESVLLSVVGGALGLLIATWSLDALRWLNPGNIPRMQNIRIDGRVLAFTFLAAMATGVLFGLVPALRVSMVSLSETLKEGGRSMIASGSHRLRSLLVVAEIALSLVLLIGAGLLIRSFIRVQQVEPGFAAENVISMRMSAIGTAYADESRRRVFYPQLFERVRRLPGVESVGAVSVLPLGPVVGWGGISIEGYDPAATGQESIQADFRIATVGYFETMKIPLISGRFFTDQDNQDATKAVIIDENMARTYWPSSDPIGKRLKQGGPTSKAPWLTIVGVVGNVKQYALDTGSRVATYLPHLQFPGSGMHVVTRTTGDPAMIATSVTDEARAMDPNVPVYDIKTMKARLSESLARRRFAMVSLGLFAGVAMLLAVVGVYGVMSYTVSQRTREIGIRVALGAETRDVIKLVIRQGMSLTVIGVALGLMGAIAATRVMASLLFGVSAIDPLTFSLIALLLVGVALAACLVPARRATKVDPMIALRYE